MQRRLRIVVLDTYFTDFLRDFYRARPGQEAKSYAEQRADLLAMSFGTSDCYSRNFNLRGHEAVELIANCEPLQRTWSSEHTGVDPGTALSRSQLSEIARRQIEELSADLAYVQDPHFLRRADLRKLRRAGVALIAQIATRSPNTLQMREFDLVITSFPHYVRRYQRRGIRAEYFPLAFDSDVIPKLSSRGVDTSPDSPRDLGISFVGGISRRQHKRAQRLLGEVAEPLQLEVFGYGAARLRSDSPMRSRHHGEVWGLDMYEAIARSKLILNRHGEVAAGYANNMRLFEATGMGSVVLTEAAPNLKRLFEPGVEVVTYTGANDLIVKAQRLLENDAERVRIATAGQRRTLAEHTYRDRVAEIAEFIELHF
jgi:spore maturation protein CgeB